LDIPEKNRKEFISERCANQEGQKVSREGHQIFTWTDYQDVSSKRQRREKKRRSTLVKIASGPEGRECLPRWKKLKTPVCQTNLDARRNSTKKKGVLSGDQRKK